jgi:group I intron endonuclease
MLQFILYRTTNIINNEIYIGVHETKNINDGYLGSGLKLKRAIRKYGKDNFKREILELFPSREEMYAAEKAIVTEEFIKRPDVYNMTVGGNMPPNHRKGKKNWNSGLKTGPQTKEHIEKRFKSIIGRPSKLKGRITPEQVKEKIGKANKGKLKGREPWNKGKVGVQSAWNKGISPSEETKQKISKTMKTKKSVLCVDTGEIFSSLSSASKEKKINRENISNCAHGKIACAGGLKWKFI